MMNSLIVVALLLGGRLLWQRYPSLLTCALFWSATAAIVLIGWTWDASNALFVAGIACNAAVTLANGGFMPVAAFRKGQGAARSVWVQRTDSQHLLFLADNWGNRHIRFSVGDTLLLGGIVLAIVGL